MPRKPPGARARGIGAELRSLREEAEVSLIQAAKAMGMTKSTLSRLETGQRNIAVEEVAGLLAIFKVSGPERDRLLAEARVVDEPGWFETGTLGMTRDSATLVDYESKAISITNWAPLLVPGMLQTIDYARAFMSLYGLASADIENRLTARARRQQALWNPDLKYTALIGEAALTGMAGQDRIMAMQIEALVSAAQRGNITLRLVPDRVPPHLGQLGAFVLLQFARSPRVVHVEMARSGVFLDEDALTDIYVEAVNQVEGVAASETESLSAIAQLGDRLRR